MKLLEIKMRGCFFKYLLVAIILFVAIYPIHAEDKSISGTILDENGNPVIGATVYIFSNDKFLAGGAANESGDFRIKINNDDYQNLRIEITAIGYSRFADKAKIGQVDVSIYLKSELLPVGKITVRSTEQIVQSNISLSRETIKSESRRSLIGADPIAAIKQPQTISAGSNHSSKLRINGTNPIYYINGIEIGQDPNHYGMFSIFPASIIDKIQFNPQGTNASQGLSSTINMQTGKPYSRGLDGEINISSIEATGSFQFGAKRYFLLGAIRQSTIDKLIRMIEIESDRRTIPPTGFQDIFISGGLKISNHLNIYTDQYFVRDQLSLNTGSYSTGQNDMNTSQRTKRNHIGFRMEYLARNILFNISFAHRDGLENYSAIPTNTDNYKDYHISLSAMKKEYQIGIKSTIDFGISDLTLGHNLNIIEERSFELDHANWNFLPPDYRSDNPYIYQNELNQYYGKLTFTDEQTDHSSYISNKFKMGFMELETGLRFYQFSNLMVNNMTTLRSSLNIKIGQNSGIDIFYGEFAENPVNNILEPYQVLVHLEQSSLMPIRTELFTAGISVSSLRLSFFSKKIKQLPVISPKFEIIDAKSESKEYFLGIESGGTADFYGGDINFSNDRMFNGKINLHTFYGFTIGNKVVESVQYPFGLNATHKFYGRIDYKLRPTITVGTDLTVRSGYPYTPIYDYSSDKANIYSSEYYQASLENENSEQFPTTLILNVHSEFEFDNLILSFGISNLTNNANAVINNTNGYIYDFGIMPTIGLSYKF